MLQWSDFPHFVQNKTQTTQTPTHWGSPECSRCQQSTFSGDMTWVLTASCHHSTNARNHAPPRYTHLYPLFAHFIFDRLSKPHQKYHISSPNHNNNDLNTTQSPIENHFAPPRGGFGIFLNGVLCVQILGQHPAASVVSTLPTHHYLKKTPGPNTTNKYTTHTRRNDPCLAQNIGARF